LRLGNIEGVLSATETFSKNPRTKLCTPYIFCKIFSPGRGMLKKPPQTGKTIFNVPFSSITSISEIIMRNM
jgi:hypothetical protein